METFAFLLFVLFISASITGYLRSYALKKNIIDIPNARSSHMLPTPRGGGVAIVLVFLGVLFWYQQWALFAAGMLVSGVGWLDDCGHVRSSIRLLFHLSGSALVLYSAGGMPPFTLFGIEQQWGWMGHILALFAVAWILNLYNFMDGIDGIAGVEAISVVVVLALCISWVSYGGSEVGQVWIELLGLLAATVAGFLCWNWPPAKIFMGDSGSGFLGLMLGAAVVHSAAISAQFFWVTLIMLGVFIVDATMTLIRRLLRGDKVYEAHRSHAYQFASRHYGDHQSVSVAVLLINLLWLAPLAWITAVGYMDGTYTLLIAYFPLVILGRRFNAGGLES